MATSCTNKLPQILLDKSLLFKLAKIEEVWSECKLKPVTNKQRLMRLFGIKMMLSKIHLLSLSFLKLKSPRLLKLKSLRLLKLKNLN